MSWVSGAPDPIIEFLLSLPPAHYMTLSDDVDEAHRIYRALGNENTAGRFLKVAAQLTELRLEVAKSEPELHLRVYKVVRFYGYRLGGVRESLVIRHSKGAMGSEPVIKMINKLIRKGVLECCGRDSGERLLRCLV